MMATSYDKTAGAELDGEPADHKRGRGAMC